MRRALAAAVLAALALCAGAAAHGVPGGGPNPYFSTVRGIVPSAGGIFVEVLGQDDRLWIDNSTGKRIVVFGYQGEEYLRFERNGVFRNANSPATYLNGDRYGRAQVPPTATADAEPLWRRVSRDSAYDWHDHRIHWMSTIPPGVVQADPSKPHRLFRWRIPIEIDGNRHAIVGTLVYEPPPGEGGGMWLLVGVAGGLTLLAIGGAFVAVRVLRRTPSA